MVKCLPLHGASADSFQLRSGDLGFLEGAGWAREELRNETQESLPHSGFAQMYSCESQLVHC